MKFAAPLFVASVLATSALAYSVPEAQFESREIADINTDALLERGFVEGLAGRELSDEEYDLVTRKFSIGKLFRGAARIGKGLLGFRRDLEDLAGREISDEEFELAARKFSIGKLFRGAARIGKGLLGFRRDLDMDMDDLDAREYVEELVGRELDDEEFELLARKFSIGKLFRGAARIGKGLLGFRRDLDMEELDARDFEDLEEIDARDFEDLEELDARELEELVEREPIFGAFRLAKGAAKLAFRGARKLFGREMLEDDLVERDLDFDDLFEREYEVDELD